MTKKVQLVFANCVCPVTIPPAVVSSAKTMVQTAGDTRQPSFLSTAGNRMGPLVAFIVLAFCLVFGLIGRWLGKTRGGVLLGFWLGFLLGPVGLALVLIDEKRKKKKKAVKVTPHTDHSLKVEMTDMMSFMCDCGYESEWPMRSAGGKVICISCGQRMRLPKLVECPECAKRYSSQQTSCPACGRET